MKMIRKKVTERMVVCMLIMCLVYNMIPAFALNAQADTVTNKAALTMNGTTTQYATFADALTHASGTATITLLGDDSYNPHSYQIGSWYPLHSLTITSNGAATLTCLQSYNNLLEVDDDGVLTIDGPDLTITGSFGIFMNGGILNFKSGILDQRQYDKNPIRVYKGTVNILGGTVKSPQGCISVAGTSASGVLNISGGKIKSTQTDSMSQVGIQFGTFTVNLSGEKNLVLENSQGTVGSIDINSGVTLNGKMGSSYFTGSVKLNNSGLNDKHPLALGDTAVLDASPDATYSYWSNNSAYRNYGFERSGDNLIICKGYSSAPSGLTGSISSINGTTTDMEYATTETATTWTTCSSGSTAVSYGKWYVRFKETATKKASPAVAVNARKSCTIHYDANGMGTAPNDQASMDGITISEPAAPQQSGYKFGGWYKEASCVNKWNFSTDVVTDSMTLWAKWGIPLNKPTISGNTFFIGGQQSAVLSGFDTGKMNVSGDKNTNAGTYDVTVSLKDKNTYCWSDGSTDDLHLSWVIQAFTTNDKATANIADGGSTTNNSPIVLTAPTGYKIASSLSNTWATTLTTGKLKNGKNTIAYYLKRIADGYIDANAKTYIINVSTKADGNVMSSVDTTTSPSKVTVTGADQIFSQLANDVDKGYTAADKAIVDAGGSADIQVKVDKLEYKTFQDKVDAIDKTAGDSGLTVGLFLDLSVTKILKSVSGVETTTQLKELPTLLTFQIDLPEKLIGMKQYVIYRHHDNKVDVITSTPNNDGEMVTVSNDGKQLILKIKKFSVYAIGYKKTADDTSTVTNNAADNTASTITSAKPAKTGDETNIMIWFTLLLASSGVLGTATMIRRKKQQSSKIED